MKQTTPVTGHYRSVLIIVLKLPTFRYDKTNSNALYVICLKRQQIRLSPTKVEKNH